MAKRKALKIRTIGTDTGRQGLTLPEYNKLKKRKKNNSKSKLSLSDLKITPPNNSNHERRKPKPSPRLNVSALDSLKISKNNIREFLKTTPTGISAHQALNSLSLPDIQVKLDIPKGVKEDELNKRELVFYGFQRRTAIAYINSFYSQLNKFENKYPSLHFPLTQRKQKLTGRVSYDHEGNILKIESVKWSDQKKLQAFFMNVLKNINSLPNPPKEILSGDQFAIYFTLSVN